MKPSSRALAARGFTLIELLIVVAIIGVLAGLAMGAAGGVMKKAKKVRTQAALKDIQLGIKNYQVEYNRYPVRAGQTSEDPIKLSEGQALVSIMLGKNQDNLNPREIAYIEPPIGKNGAGGLVGNEGSYGLVDFYGEPYEVIMDLNYDNKIRNPDVQNEDPDVSKGAPTVLPIGVAVYSLGEDKKVNTKDDVVSWRN